MRTIVANKTGVLNNSFPTLVGMVRDRGPDRFFYRSFPHARGDGRNGIQKIEGGECFPYARGGWSTGIVNLENY